MTERREIECLACGEKVSARLTTGQEVYPHRADLHAKPFWRCDGCQNYIGCHRNSRSHAPLGSIPSPELRSARNRIHRLLDPLWRSGRFKRGAIYRALSAQLGWSYHTAKIRTVEEARDIYRAIQRIRNEGLPEAPKGESRP